MSREYQPAQRKTSPRVRDTAMTSCARRERGGKIDGSADEEMLFDGRTVRWRYSELCGSYGGSGARSHTKSAGDALRASRGPAAGGAYVVACRRLHATLVATSFRATFRFVAFFRGWPT